MLTSYEVVKNAIYFNNPERLPVEFEPLGISDTHYVNWNQTGVGDKTKRIDYDEWNCRWERTEVENMGQVTGHPLIDWKDINSYKWPDPDNQEFYEGMEDQFAGSENKYIITGIFMLLFERMHSLRGFENLLTDLYLEKEKIENLADRIVEYDIRIIENISAKFPGQIHGFKFTDDWGTQQNTFISVDLWNEFFKPRYKRIFDAIREAGWEIWMHSCGKINDFIPSLIDIGCNVLNMQQPRTCGIEEIGRRFSGKVCFSSLNDVQNTLPFKSAEEIEEEAKQLLDCWGTEKGGFILSDYGDAHTLGVSDETEKIMYDAFMKHDRWRNK